MRQSRRSNDGEGSPVSREAILGEAVRLFSERGYRQTSLEMIARRFGVTRQALYYYFPSKDELLIAVYRETMELLTSSSDRLFASSEPPAERLGMLLSNHARVVAAHSKRMRIFHRDWSSLPRKHREIVLRMRRAYNDRIVKVYEEGVNEGVFRDIDAELASFFLLGSCNWIDQWYRPGLGLSPEELGEMLMRFLRDGYEIRPGSGGSAGQTDAAAAQGSPS